MKVFISNIDSPLGFLLSKLLSQTVVGSRREEEQPEEEVEDETVKKEEKVKTHYTIVGTLTPFKHVLPSDPDFAMAIHHPSNPGNYFETMDKKKNTARKDAIQKFATPGQKPKWVSEIIPVYILL
jgi:adenylate kinase